MELVVERTQIPLPGEDPFVEGVGQAAPQLVGARDGLAHEVPPVPVEAPPDPEPLPAGEVSLAALQAQVARLAAQNRQLNERVTALEQGRRGSPGNPAPRVNVVRPQLALPVIAPKAYARAQCADHGMVSTNGSGQCGKCAQELARQAQPA